MVKNLIDLHYLIYTHLHADYIMKNAVFDGNYGAVFFVKADTTM